MRVVKLTEIAREHHIPPKRARRVLRRLYSENPKRLPRPVNHWAFKERDVPRVAKIISE